ncbi:MAG TPA: nucleotidyltransferase family protein [Candidatus Limnocylindrales bacterium]
MPAPASRCATARDSRRPFLPDPAAPAGTAGLVLAAGDATRFGSAKMLALLDGRPLLQHVLDAVAEAGLERTVVVLGRSAVAIEAAIEWRGEIRVVNPTPEAGLSSTVRLGFEAVGGLEPIPDAVLILLGNQPHVRPAVIDRLVGWSSTARPIVVPRYGRPGGFNPVLVRRPAWPLVGQATGDRGLGPLIEAHRELVQEVPVDGDNPDVDVPADLAMLQGRG